MTKDARYTTAKNEILAGHVKTVPEFFSVIKKSVVAKDLGISLDRFDKMIIDVSRFNMGKLFKIAALLEIDEHKFLSIICNQWQVQGKKPVHIKSKAKKKK